MPVVHMGVIKTLTVPVKGLLTRVDFSVLVAPEPAPSGPIIARLIIVDKSFPNNGAGFAALKLAYENQVWDSNIAGSLDIPIITVGKKKSRIFSNGGLDYENQDTPQVGRLYAFIEVDQVTALLQTEVNVQCKA